MHTLLGLLGVLVYIPVVSGLAAVVTWAVVKISPAPKPKPDQA